MIVKTKPRSGNAQADRSRIEFQICKRWKSNGKLEWTDDELQREVSRLLQLSRPETSRPLFDCGQAAQDSRSVAFASAAVRECDRREAVLGWLAKCGPLGATRAEIALGIFCQQCAVTRTVLDLINCGEAVELSKKRQSAHGGAGVVVVLSKYQEAAK